MSMLFYNRKCQACRKCDNDVFSISIYIELIMYFAYEFLYSFYNVSKNVYVQILLYIHENRYVKVLNVFSCLFYSITNDDFKGNFLSSDID